MSSTTQPPQFRHSTTRLIRKKLHHTTNQSESTYINRAWSFPLSFAALLCTHGSCRSLVRGGQGHRIWGDHRRAHLVSRCLNLHHTLQRVWSNQTHAGVETLVLLQCTHTAHYVTHQTIGELLLQCRLLFVTDQSFKDSSRQAAICDSEGGSGAWGDVNATNWQWDGHCTVSCHLNGYLSLHGPLGLAAHTQHTTATEQHITTVT